MKSATQIAKELGTSVYKLHRILHESGFLRSTPQGYRLVDMQYGQLVQNWKYHYRFTQYNKLGQQKIKEIYMIHKLKLHKNEAILPENPHIELDVRTRLHELGVTEWLNKLPTLTVSYNEIAHPLRVTHTNRLVHDVTGHRKVISGTEWLNRHGIFVQGQEVLVRDTDTWSTCTRIYLHDNLCVCTGHEYHYKNGHKYAVCEWAEIKSPYPPFEPEEHTIHIPEGNYSIQKLQEFFKEHKK